MSAKQRSEAHKKAWAKGDHDFWTGKPNRNPYKCSPWGLGLSWSAGYNHAKTLAERGVKHALYGNPLDVPNALVTRPRVVDD